MDHQNKYDYMCSIEVKEDLYRGAISRPFTIRLFLSTYVIHLLAFEAEFGDHRLDQHRVPTTATTLSMLKELG